MVAFGRLEPLREDGKPSSPPLADGATDNDDSGSTSGDSCALPSLAVWQQTQAASRASMLRVESTLAALTEALGKVQAQQQASAERTESGMAALASTMKEIQNVQQNYVSQVGSPGALDRARAVASSGGGGEGSPPAGVQQAAGLLLAPIVRRRRSNSHHNAASHTPSSFSEAGAKVQPSSPRTFSS